MFINIAKRLSNQIPILLSTITGKCRCKGPLLTNYFHIYACSTTMFFFSLKSAEPIARCWYYSFYKWAQLKHNFVVGAIIFYRGEKTLSLWEEIKNTKPTLYDMYKEEKRMRKKRRTKRICRTKKLTMWSNKGGWRKAEA